MKVLLVIYDNDSYIHWFPQGASYIASALLKHGHTVEIYNQDKFHFPDEHLTQYLDEKRFDVVGVGVIAGYYQYRKLLKLSEAINNARHRPFYIIGGHGPSPEPEFFLRKTGADAAVIGEGEETVVELLGALSNNSPLKEVKGIAFAQNGDIHINDKRPLLKDIDAIPFPAYHLFPIDYYRLLRMPHVKNTDFVMPLLSSRGCPYTCAFCYHMDTQVRLRSNESVIDEIKLLKEGYGINYIAFADELLMVSKERAASLCESFLKSGLNIKWDCNGRLNFACADVLKLMRRAGCVFINYGIEAMDNDVLKNMKKSLTVEQIIKGIEETLKAGISPGFNIIFGNLGDSKETLKKGVEFLLKYDDGAQMRTIRPVTPYPGSPLYYYAKEKGMLAGAQDFYENKHSNSDLLSVNFTDMSDEEFHGSLLEANRKLFENYFQKKTACFIKQAQDLYLKRDADFRGFRQT